MKTAIIYARFSSDNQRAESITAQLRACTDYALKEGIQIIGEYIDEAKSATSDDRPQFQKMFKDLREKVITPNLLIVHKLDRFARSRYDSIIYRRELKKVNMSLVSVLERLDDSPESIILESMLEGMAEYYSKNLAREVAKGMKETALQGKYTGGRVPYGYIVGPDQKLLPDPDRAGAIKLIFEMFADGKEYKEIIAELTKKGYKSFNGGQFMKSSIHDMLQNEKYLGINVFNKASSADMNGKRNNRKHKDSADIIKVPNAFQALVSMETFIKCQERFKTRDHSTAGFNFSKQTYLLSGKVICGECGEKVYGGSFHYTTRVSGEKRERYCYYCSNRKKGACDMKRISKQELEDVVKEEIEFLLDSESSCAILAKKSYEKMVKENKESSGDGKKLKKDIANHTKQIQRVIDLLLKFPDSQTDELMQRMSNLQSEKVLLETELVRWEVSQSGNITEKTIYKYLLSRNLMLKNGTDEEKKHVFDEFVDNITLGNKEVVINLKFTTVTTSGGARVHPVVVTVGRLNEIMKPPYYRDKRNCGRFATVLCK
jgi:site-specific DNA recombinase